MGIVEGMHISEVEKKYKDIYLKWRDCRLEDTTTRFENGETKAEVRQRILEVLNTMPKKPTISASASPVTALPFRKRCSASESENTTFLTVRSCI